MDEIAMQLRHRFRMLEHDFRHERAGLQVASPLELEHVALGADDRAAGELLQEGDALRSGCGHVGAASQGMDIRLSHLRGAETSRSATQDVAGNRP